MPSNALKPLALAAAAVLLSSAAPSAAQPAPQTSRDDAPYAGAQRPDPAAMAERRAQRLRDVLQLRRDQEPALQALMSGMGPSGERARRFDRGEGQEAMTTPQRLERMRQRMGERQAAFERRADAVMRFYGQLAPAQQRAFDAMRPMAGREGMGMHRGMMRGEGMRGGDGRGGDMDGPA